MQKCHDAYKHVQTGAMDRARAKESYVGVNVHARAREFVLCHVCARRIQSTCTCVCLRLMHFTELLKFHDLGAFCSIAGHSEKSFLSTTEFVDAELVEQEMFFMPVFFL